MKLFQKLIAAPAIISMASGLAVNAAEINQPEFSPFTKSPEVISTGDFKSDLLVPGDWAYDSLKDLSKSPRFNGSPVHRIEAAAELNRLIAGGEGLMNGAQIDRLSDELGSELAIMKGRVDGLEARVNGIEAGSFSETTSMSGKVEMQIGAGSNGAAIVGDNNNEEQTTFAYHYEVDLNTSFTGDDKLNIEFAAGNAAGTNTVQGITGFGESQDALTIEDVNYTFPLGRWDVSVGDSMDLSKNFPNACALGTIVDAMDDCGAKNAVDAGGDVSVSLGTEFADGWEFGFGFSGDSGTSGIATKESTDGLGAALGYSNDTYGFTFGYALADGGATANSDTTYYGATAYYTPEGMGTLSGGVEIGTKQGANKDTSQFKVGYATDLGEGTFEVGFGTNGAIADGSNEVYAYEASYSFPINDGVSMTAFGYIAEVDGQDEDNSGLGLTTTFKF
jgi:hypothetical protein